MNEVSPFNTFDEYFNEIKKIWSKLENPNRIIPFCTPLKQKPKFLIIGNNHSNNFDPRNKEENNRIANSFSNAISTQDHTFLDHNHPFAKGLRGLVSDISTTYKNFKITREWIGTNRCAIQTNSGGLGDEIKKHDKYIECQKEMDSLLKDFIKFCKPKNIILTGKSACELYYSTKNLKDMECKKILLGKDTDETTNLIPIWHLSELWRQDRHDNESFKQKTITRIKNAIEDGYCDL